MAEFIHKQGKRQDDRGLGSVIDFLLANTRLVLGVSGAAVLAIATLVVKRVRLAASLWNGIGKSGLGYCQSGAWAWAGSSCLLPAMRAMAPSCKGVRSSSASFPKPPPPHQGSRAGDPFKAVTLLG